METNSALGSSKESEGIIYITKRWEILILKEKRRIWTSDHIQGTKENEYELIKA